MAAEGLISFDELRDKLGGLEEAREAARRALDAISERRARLAEIEHERDELLETCSEKASAGLDRLAPEERHRAYKKLRLVVLVHPNLGGGGPVGGDAPKGDLEITGVLKEAVGKVSGLSNSELHPAVPRG
jgi:hypothetical protein